ncbi:MAG: ABC transporter ATP-binding protein/permease [Lactobacillales bacterium]|jgi:ATP-binding cassette subfamily B protein|nr:ABC transporter ATP-binding protein/permease [Lactobacillales bacterium]
MYRMFKRIAKSSFVLAVFFMAIQVLSSLYLPTLTSNIIDKGVAKSDIAYIWKVGFAMVGYSLISILAAVANTFFATRESQKLGRSLHSDVYQKVENFSNDEFEQFGTASLITRTTNDVTQIQNVTQMFLRMMIRAPITLVGASFLAYSRDAQLTKIFLIVLPIMAVVIVGTMRFAVPLFKAMQAKTDRLNLVFREGLTGVRVIRAFNKEEYEEKRFEEANMDYTNNAVRVQTIIAMMNPLMTLIMSGTNVAIVWWGGHYIASQSMQVGNLIAFMTYSTQILMSFMMLSMIFVMVPRAQASAERIFALLDTKEEVTDSEHPVAIEPQFESATLTFDDVSYRYKGAENCAVNNISFQVKSGDVVAIIGGTGSGKSTLVNLIPRFYDVEKGEILVNGVDIRQVKQHALRSLIGFVPQQSILFSGTLRMNMQYGKADATDDEIWRALSIAQAKEFIDKLPDGLDTWVEQGGSNFSGGQKQRLAIARALVRKSDIYVFDDSFSALDFKTDSLLRKQLRESITDAIKVIVAQRVSTVMDADMILVLNQSEIVGKGTHEELLANNQTYREIVDSQLRGDERS